MFEILGMLVLMVGVAGIGRRLEGSWIAPAPFFVLLWAGYLIADLFFVQDLVPLAPATLFVLLACAAIVAGSALGSSLAGVPVRGPLPTSTSRGQTEFRWLRGTTAVLVAAGLVEVGWIVVRSGLSVGGLLSVSWIAQISAHNREAYGFGDLQQSLPERGLIALLYTGPFFGGLLLRVGRTLNDKLLGIATLVLVFMVGTLYGSRMGALYGSSCWIGAYIAASFFGANRQGAVALRRLFLWASGSAVVAILGLSLLAMIIRYGGISGVKSLESMVADPFGFFPAFAQWYHERGVVTSDFSYGYQTFTRFFEIAGVRFPEHEVVDIGFTTSNIFTALRGMIEDFGWVGALAFVFALGVGGGIGHRKVAQGHREYISILALVYAFSFTSLAFSLFRYTSVTFGAVAFCFYFATLHWSDVQAHRRLQNP